MAVDERLVADHRHTIRDWVVDRHLEFDDGLATVGRDGGNGNVTGDITDRDAIHLGAAAHIGGVGGDAVLHQHIGRVGDPVVGNRNRVSEGFAGFGNAVTITTRGGIRDRLDVAQVCGRDHRRRAAIGDVTVGRAAVRVATGWLTVDHALVGDLIHISRDGIVDRDLEADGGHAAIGRNGRQRPVDVTAIKAATVVGTARDIGGVRRNRVGHHHRASVAGTVIGNLNLVGQHFARFGYAIAVGIRHALDRREIGRRDRRRFAGVRGIRTGLRTIDGRLVGDLINGSRDGIGNCHLEGNRRGPAVGRNRRNGPVDAAADPRPTVAGAARHIGRVGGNSVVNHHIGGVGNAVDGDDQRVGQRFPSFGHTVAIGIHHRLHGEELRGGDDGGITGIDRVITAWAAVDGRLVGNRGHAGGQRVIHRDGEFDHGHATIGANRRDGHASGDVVGREAVDLGRVLIVARIGRGVVLDLDVRFGDRAIVCHFNAIGEDLTRLGNAIAIGVHHRLDARQVRQRDDGRFTGIGRVGTGSFAVDRGLIADFIDASRQRIVNGHLERDGRRATIGRNVGNGPGDGAAIKAAAVIGAAIHVGGVGRDGVADRHVGGVTQAVVGNHDLIGQRFPSLGHAVAITVDNALDADEIGRRHDGRLTGINRVGARGHAINGSLVTDFGHAIWNRISYCHLESHYSCATVGRNG